MPFTGSLSPQVTSCTCPSIPPPPSVRQVSKAETSVLEIQIPMAPLPLLHVTHPLTYFSSCSTLSLRTIDWAYPVSPFHTHRPAYGHFPDNYTRK